MQIIGITGLAQCGKTTLAKEIARVAYDRGMKPKQMSFAGSLKRAAAAIGADKETQPELYRKFCQEVGKNLRDPAYVPGVTGPNWWVERTKMEVHQVSDMAFVDGVGGETVILFDDVRFQNEVDMLKAAGATMIYVDREDELPDPTGAWRTHDSERMAYDLRLDHDLRSKNFQFTVCSAGSMDEYLQRVAPFIPVWLGLAGLHV